MRQTRRILEIFRGIEGELQEVGKEDEGGYCTDFKNNELLAGSIGSRR